MTPTYRDDVLASAARHAWHARATYARLCAQRPDHPLFAVFDVATVSRCISLRLASRPGARKNSEALEAGLRVWGKRWDEGPLQRPFPYMPQQSFQGR